MKKFLFILFPVLLIASCVGNYQNDTPPAITVDTKPIIEEIKTPVAPEIETVNTAPAKELKVENPIVKSAIESKEDVSVVKPVTELKAETPIVKTIAEPTLSNNNHYTNVDGEEVHSPAYAPSVPAGASAICRDGTYSFSQHRSGTCSHHGGVAEWL